MNSRLLNLLDESREAFNKSDIRKFAEDNNFSWFYNICTTRITPNNILIVGFNCAAEKEKTHEPQLELPKESFKDLKDLNWLGSLKRIYNPLMKYLPEENINNCIQTNICFFRSEKEKQISHKDLLLSIPLFNKFIEIVKPKMIIGFSSALRNHFKDKLTISEYEFVNILSGSGKTKKIFESAKCKFSVGGKNIPVYFLPHPNYRITKNARVQAWEFCFGKPK